MGQNPTDSEVNDMINEVDVEGSGVVEFEVICRQFHQHFKSSFSANFQAPKNYETKVQVQKSWGCNFHFEKLLI